MFPKTLDRYLLRRTLAPMSAVLISTMVAFLMERLMRSFDLLSQTTEGFRYLTELLVNLTPHYVGLTLPGGFFIGLFVVVNGLNKSSEIDAILASGTSLARFTTPFVALGVLLMVLSIILFGFVQPYSRYAYHAVLHAAENAGWNGDVRPKALLSAGPDFFLTADRTDASGRYLQQVFIRRIDPNGREDILTAVTAVVHKSPADSEIALELTNGRQISTVAGAQSYVVNFSRLMFNVPAGDAGLLRLRGEDVSELTLIELARQGGGLEPAALPRETLLAALYARLARALILPLLPLIAVPFGLSAKRAGSGAAIATGGVLLFAFEILMVLGQAMATRATALAAVALPALIFAAICVATFVVSQRRPGENPVSWFIEKVAAVADAVIKAVRRRRVAEVSGGA
jgi:lipopolysaccharide export system permease protein